MHRRSDVGGIAYGDGLGCGDDTALGEVVAEMLLLLQIVDVLQPFLHALDLSLLADVFISLIQI